MNTTERANAWGMWISAILDAKIPTGEAVESFRESLNDIPLRDALLSYAGHNPGSRESFAAILKAVTAEPTAPALSVFAAVAYLDGDMESAGRSVAEALNANENYSLAGLLSMGLGSNASPALLERSFTHFSPEELLELA